MRKQLVDWVAEKQSNGISQHDAAWHEDKVYTVGGSTLAAVQGGNSYDTVDQVIQKRVGLIARESSIYMQWGNLFEDLIKKYVESQHNCEILGENLYVKAEGDIAYSPDGLSVMTVSPPPVFDDEPAETYETIVLHEFKCPFKRIPYKTPPANYVVQLKMGLDMLKLPTIGILSEGVFRRCSMDQLGFTPGYDTTLVEKSRGKIAIAYGFVGFIATPEGAELIAKVVAEVPGGDLGLVSVGLIEEIFDAYDRKLITPHYSQMALPGEKPWELATEYAQFRTVAAEMAVGILPWKLFHVQETYVRKEENFLAPWMDKIKEIIGVIRACDGLNDAQKRMVCAEYAAACTESAFC